MRRARVTRVYIDTSSMPPGQTEALLAAGYGSLSQAERYSVLEPRR